MAILINTIWLFLILYLPKISCFHRILHLGIESLGFEILSNHICLWIYAFTTSLSRLYGSLKSYHFSFLMDQTKVFIFDLFSFHSHHKVGMMVSKLFEQFCTVIKSTLQWIFFIWNWIIWLYYIIMSHYPNLVKLLYLLKTLNSICK